VEHIEVNGARLGFRQSGSGALALFVHGFTLDSRMWLHQLRDLGDLRWCVAPDLRGRGGSALDVGGVNSTELLADDLAGLITGLGGHVADLVAFSMGGYAALALLEHHPRLVRSLVLVDAKATADTEDGKAGRDAAVDSLLATGRAGFAEGLVPKLVSSHADAAISGAVRTMIEDTPDETLIADLRGMRDRPDRTGVLSTSQIRTLVLVGDEDVLSPPSDAAWISEHAPGSRLVTVPRSGHMTPMERPTEVNEAIRAFWEGAGG
jgi:pimeloyl-ACP methyl ester carboxylesterase